MADTADTAQASLVVRGGADSGRTVSLGEGPILLGRRSDNDVVVDEYSVSRRHAVVVETPAGFVIRDLNTSNGTFVNRDNIGHRERLLRHGNRIRLAGSEVTFIFQQKGPRTVVISVEPSPADEEAMASVGGRDDEGVDCGSSLIGRDGELHRLLESRRRTVVSREQIARHIWPELAEGALADRVIDESIQRLRAHIEDDPLKPVRLITAGEVGYLLV